MSGIPSLSQHGRPHPLHYPPSLSLAPTSITHPPETVAEMCASADSADGSRPYYPLLGVPLAIVYGAVSEARDDQPTMGFCVVPMNHITPYTTALGGEKGNVWLKTLEKKATISFNKAFGALDQGGVAKVLIRQKICERFTGPEDVDGPGRWGLSEMWKSLLSTEEDLFSRDAVGVDDVMTTLVGAAAMGQAMGMARPPDCGLRLLVDEYELASVLPGGPMVLADGRGPSQQAD